MTGWKLFLISWDFEPSVVIGCVVMLGAYLALIRFKFNKQALNFTLGVLVIFLALVSPVDKLGEDYLFSAHMMQHMMLGIIAPVFLVAGIPTWMATAVLRFKFIAWIERLLGNPTLALLTANATFWVWHLPKLYNLTLENETVHVFEHMTFMITGTMLWWPVFKPIPQGRLGPLAAIAYMGIAAFISTILGIIFTVSDTPYYQCYAHPEDELGALKLIREGWGLSQIDDQKLGGAIMWEPAGAIFLWAIIRVLMKWFKDDADVNENTKEERRKENAEAN